MKQSFLFKIFLFYLALQQTYGKRSAEAEKALSMNERATLLEPNNTRLRWNLALAQLKNGKIKEGIKNYEARLEWREFPSPIRKFVLPKKWHPNIDLSLR